MSIMQNIYFDNNMIRHLSKNPEYFDTIYDIFVFDYGKSFKSVQSYYLFFEYYGLSNLKLNAPKNKFDFKINDQIVAENNINNIDTYIVDYFNSAYASLQEPIIEEKI
jgi:hypothetical protein